MSYASERLEYLNQQYSYAQISAVTEIPTATISYVIRDIRQLPVQYQPALRNFYQRTAYADLRAAGMSATQARRFSWYSPQHVMEIIAEVGDIVSMLARSRLEQYTDYLQRTGQYVDEQTTLDILKQSIREAIQKSDLPEERIAAMEYANTNEL